MDIKRTISRLVYQIEAKPEGGFIARCKDPDVPAVEGATREELDQKIQASIKATLAAEFPGLKLPLEGKEVKFSYHLEAKPGGGYIVRHENSSQEPIEGSIREKLESLMESKMAAKIMENLPPEISQQLASQVNSGGVDITVQRRVGFSFARAGQATQALAEDKALQSFSALDNSPIKFEARRIGSFFRFFWLVLLLASLAYFFLHRH